MATQTDTLTAAQTGTLYDRVEGLAAAFTKTQSDVADLRRAFDRAEESLLAGLVKLHKELTAACKVLDIEPPAMPARGGNGARRRQTAGAR